MATYSSRQVQKKHSNRGNYSLSKQSVGGYFNLVSGVTYAQTTDNIRMVRMGENTRPTKITVYARRKDGTLALSTAAFNVGVAPLSATQANFVRPTGQTFTPIVADAARFGNVDLATDGQGNLIDLPAPRTTPDWAPYFITLTPSAVGGVVPTGDHELIMEVEFVGEEDPTAPAFTSFP